MKLNDSISRVLRSLLPRATPDTPLAIQILICSIGGEGEQVEHPKLQQIEQAVLRQASELWLCTQWGNLGLEQPFDQLQAFSFEGRWTVFCTVNGEGFTLTNTAYAGRELRGFPEVKLVDQSRAEVDTATALRAIRGFALKRQADPSLAWCGSGVAIVVRDEEHPR